jgi:queuine/archaeosine tRNA-ribosyltransferase
MKFFFPDSLDVVDPSFDFVTERRSPTRVRQRDDLYPHEIFTDPPYDGILLSKAIVDGTSAGASAKYSIAQRHRLLRMGVREFFRLDHPPRNPRLLSLGDCGAFSYVKEERPPYTVEEVIDFYECCGFDFGMSVDHVILGYQSESTPLLPGVELDTKDWKKRQNITLDLAREFLAEHGRRNCKFTPIGVVQGWSPSSYALATREIQKMGYTHIALGGLVPLKTHEIVEVLAAVREELREDTRMHLFGVTRCEHIPKFADYGVTSFDSTSPLRQAFKDEKDNYYTPNGNYSAVRVPQVEGNASLKRRIIAGQVNQDDAVRLERECLDLLMGYDLGKVDLDSVVESLSAYERLHDGKGDRAAIYRKVLEDKPWKQCPCEICRDLGIHVIIFRGAERNRRRGFHNLYVFENRMRRILDNDSPLIGVVGAGVATEAPGADGPKQLRPEVCKIGATSE